MSQAAAVCSTLRIWPWRRAVQALVLASIILFPVMARYGHYLWARQAEKMLDQFGSSVAGSALRATDALLRAGLPMEEAGVKGRRPRRAVLARLEGFGGSASWSARVLGVSLTDLLAGLESALASRSLRAALVLGLALPLAATLLLGRVYCGWVCPMGLLLPLARRLRGVLSFLELPTGELRFWKGNKYVVLAAGAAVALATGLPILHHLYPPAILGREAHGLATVLFDRAEAGRFGFPWHAFSAGLAFLGAVALVEVALAPGFWCATLCPGGALYAAFSRLRVLRLERDAAGCTDCALCDKACPMQLEPMTDKTGAECDACGACVDACPTKALALSLSGPAPARKGRPRRLAKETVAALALAGVLVPAARAHHIIGIPHYAYDESFPQAPVLRLRDKVGPFEVTLTGYPGSPKPGERSELRVYLTGPKADAAYDKTVLLEAYRLRAFGYRERIVDAQEAVRDGALNRYHVTYPAEANYEVVLVLPGLDGTSTLRFPMVVGEPGSPWKALSLFGGALAALVVGVRAARIKRARRSGSAPPRGAEQRGGQAPQAAGALSHGEGRTQGRGR